MLQMLLTLAAGLVGYLMARNFVRNRLRFVDSIHSPWAPFVAGTFAFLVTWPLSLLPVLSAAPAAVFGIGIGFGTAKGAKLARRDDSTYRQLTS